MLSVDIECLRGVILCRDVLRCWLDESLEEDAEACLLRILTADNPNSALLVSYKLWKIRITNKYRFRSPSHTHFEVLRKVENIHCSYQSKTIALNKITNITKWFTWSERSQTKGLEGIVSPDSLCGEPTYLRWMLFMVRWWETGELPSFNRWGFLLITR